MQLSLTAIPSSYFVYYSQDREFSQEISSLPGKGADIFQRIFDDACDVGFAIVSAKTGAERIFSLSKEIVRRHADEQEVEGWEFTEMGPMGRAVENPIKVTIHND